METRSKISCISIAILQLSNALCSRISLGDLYAMLFLKGYHHLKYASKASRALISVCAREPWRERIFFSASWLEISSLDLCRNMPRLRLTNNQRGRWSRGLGLGGTFSHSTVRERRTAACASRHAYAFISTLTQRYMNVATTTSRTVNDASRLQVICNDLDDACNHFRSAWTSPLPRAERQPFLTCKPLLSPRAVVVFPSGVKRMIDRLELGGYLLPHVVRRVVEYAVFPRSLWKSERSQMQRIKDLTVEVVVEHWATIHARWNIRVGVRVL
mmetsp:Transcript_18511/g.46382  ORF Transcript_18511/g.46382 Transcript_18511/m.46382 type:complete len:272 (-) Transcript_18511:792-1607(-)